MVNARHPLNVPSQWTARPVERFDAQLLNTRLPSSRVKLVLPLRSPDLLNYMLGCPSVGFSGFLLEKKGMLRGHLLLADLGEEVRIADLLIDSDDVEEWMACYSLAAATARRLHPRAGYLRAMAAPDVLQSAITRAGFTVLGSLTAIVQDKNNVLPRTQLPVLNMMDSDAAYFSD